MKRVTLLLAAVALVLATPGVAQAWTNIMEHHGLHYARGQTSESGYPRVRFYGGASDSGSTTYFRVALSVSCQGGYRYSDSGSVHDYPYRYWTWIVRIPQSALQGRCTLIIAVRAVSPANTNMTVGVDVP